jgi:Brp/Blh family beta-carotene 15,15'-monooxygenase
MYTGALCLVLDTKDGDDQGTFTRMTRGLSLVVALFMGMTLCSAVAPAGAEWLALALMIGAGIPHGSFDLRVAKVKWGSAESSRVAIVLCYLACVLSMSALCFFTPLIGLSLFIVISALHFAEGETQSAAPMARLRGILFGIGAILLPIGLHLDETEPYVRYFISSELFQALRPHLSASALLLTSLIGVLLTLDFSGKQDVRATIERCICFAGWITLSPLAGFAVWFIGRHSHQHLELCEGMFAASRNKIPTDFIAISLLAIIGLAPFALFFDFSDINQLFAASICLIAGLTLPHMIVSHGIRGLAH